MYSSTSTEQAATRSYPGYHPVTRWLHAGLMLGVLLQLGSSLGMAHPDEHGASAIGRAWMDFHQWDGLLVASIVLVHLLWSIAPRGNPPSRQIAVLYSAGHWREAGRVLRRLPAALAGSVPFISPVNSLSLIVEMLGLLTMAGMAASGVAIRWSGAAATHTHASGEFAWLLGTHALLAKLLWLYVAGHGFMAWMHARAGARPFARILPFGRVR